ncbi:hypothetical protein QN386_24990 [Pseudomonas sp. CCI3.2]|nr:MULTISPECIES: hypothetical protein [unclassified Pseudomonas]MEA9979729.1 hypothetical protein [Pseudomonas sp. RTS4]MEB0076833.1 hypothetical protein [Pseudomonas sp. MH10out]MEB0104564.1 hypothetical protein [Pseudomonas sp. CCI3.2]MEB0156669.1 hypothetical protein [Pseudomonas sp. AH2 (2023)]MEB0165783.1 hypothetical protein [Pseudomonas sp. CCC4.4]
MSRTTMDVAVSGMDDLFAVQDVFTNVHAIFTVMLEHFPENHTAHAFAQLGIAEVNDWSTKTLQWAECMRHELDVLWQEGAR